MKLGIIGAMDIEIQQLVADLENREVKKISKMDYYAGTLYGKDVVICKSFEGKVNAAVATRSLISIYNVDAIMCVGVAGSITDKIRTLDIVLADKLVEFDSDTTVLGYKRGHIFGLDSIYIKSCNEMLNCIYNISKKITSSAFNINNIFIGTIASSDKFVTDIETKDMLIKEFENVLAVDMESASIAHVCKLDEIPFCVIRAISDSGNKLEFREFADIAAKKIHEIVKEYLLNYD